EGLRGRAELKKSNDGVFATFKPEAVEQLFGSAQSIAANDSAPKGLRASAVALLGYGSFERSGKVLGTLLDARQPPEVQLQAIRALDRLADPRGAELIVREENWKRYTAQVRESAI